MTARGLGAATDTTLDATIRLRRGGFDLDVSLRVEPGETVAIVGPNGAGKTTILDVLAGSTPLPREAAAFGARIKVGSRVLDDPAAGIFVPPERRHIGVVFQDHRLFDHLSVLENVAFGPRARGMGRSAARSRAADLLELMGLAGFVEAAPRTLSGGQAQRVAIARALAVDPEVLLLDEPLAALDVETRASLRRVLRAHLDSFAGPRVLITHDPADAFLLADRLDVLEAGRITQSGAPDEVSRHPATPYVAALAGTNRFNGTATHGSVLLEAHEHTFTVANRSISGSVAITIHPRTVSLYQSRPEGSPRNTWRSVVEEIEPLGDITRVTLGSPVPIIVDITPGAVEALGLAPDVAIWATVKATEIAVIPD